MASFPGTANTFSERGQGGGQAFPLHGGRAEFDPRVFLGGGAALYRITREAPEQVTIPCQGTRAQMDALFGEVGQDGDLIYVGGTVAAVLASIGDTQELIGGTDLWRWTMQFLIDWTTGGPVFPADALTTQGGDTIVTQGGDTLILVEA